MKKLFAIFYTFILVVNIFSYGVLAQTETGDETSIIFFSPDEAGLTPSDFFYFLDLRHTTEEYFEEAGVEAQQGNIEAAQIALDNFEEAVEEERATLETASLDGVTLEAIDSDSHEGVQQIEGIQIKILEYEELVDAIEQTLEEQVESGSLTESEMGTIVENLDSVINDIGAEVEHRTQELIDVAAENSDVSDSEARLAYDENLREEVGDRFNEIASINDVLELEEKIAELKAEADKLREEGSLEQAAAVDRLLALAESHGENCLNSEENLFEIEADNHLNAAENIVDNLVGYLEREEFEDDSYKLMPVWPPPTIEEIREEIQDDGESAEKFIGNYEELKEKYVDDPAKLAYIEAEKSRAERVQQIDEGVLDSWLEEFQAEGLTEEEVTARVYEKVIEQDEVVNGHYEPLGLYVLPGDDGKQESEGEEGTESDTTEEEPELEVIDIGRIEIIETIDPETGEVRREVVGWHNGAEVNDVQAGGGFAFGVSYEDPETGNIVTYGSAGYTVTTEAGVTSTFDYPEGYKPSEEYQYNYGDEVYIYQTEDGGSVTYSAVGYKVEDAENEVLEEQPYTQEIVTFADGSVFDKEATGYVFTNPKGNAEVFAYNPNTQSYTGSTTGKVFVPLTSTSHSLGTVYDSEFGYKYTDNNGVVWTTSGDGTWDSSTGQRIVLPTVPAPVGQQNSDYYKLTGSWVTPSGEVWVRDPVTNTWTGTVVDPDTGATTQISYTTAPNNEYRYDGESAGYVDSRGNWFDHSNEGQSSYQNPWTFDVARDVWVSSETGDRYNERDGTITHPDGTVVGPENRPAGQGSEGVPCYGCYYEGGQSGPSVHTWNGGSYERSPDGSYRHVGSDGEYQGPTVTTDSQGNTWTRNADGSWTSPTTGTYAGDYYTGGGGYGPPGADGTPGPYVGGEYGNYDSSGAYTGGAYYGGDSSTTEGTTSGGVSGGYAGGTYTGGSTTEGTTSGGVSGGYTGGTVGDSSGGSYTSGGDSGSTSGSTTGGSSTGGDSGGDSGGSSGGDSGGGSVGGAVVAESGSAPQNPIATFFRKIACLFTNAC